MKISREQKGFTTVELVLVVVVVALVAFVGWYVWHTKQASDKSLDQATSTSQNAGPHFKSKKAEAKSSTTTPAQ